jgi:hypothetical protein
MEYVLLWPRASAALSLLMAMVLNCAGGVWWGSNVTAGGLAGAQRNRVSCNIEKSKRHRQKIVEVFVIAVIRILLCRQLFDWLIMPLPHQKKQFAHRYLIAIAPAPFSHHIRATCRS